MKNFFIVYNQEKEISGQVADEIKNLLLSKGCNVVMNDSEDVKKPYLYTNPSDVPRDTECIISIGGDGTLIRAARDTADLNVALIGVNTGHLGFLAEIEQDKISDAISRLVNDDLYIENRIRLSMRLQLENKEIIAKDTALNDIVILRNSYSGIMGLSVSVNGQHLNSYSADGIIISTPTGSTGYSLSAGGPIMEPVSDMILLTPINPHTTNSRSIVLSGSSIVEIELNERSISTNVDGIIICDGEKVALLEKNNKIRIVKSDTNTRIVRLNSLSFIKILRNKMKDE